MSGGAHRLDGRQAVAVGETEIEEYRVEAMRPNARRALSREATRRRVTGADASSRPTNAPASSSSSTRSTWSERSGIDSRSLLRVILPLYASRLRSVNRTAGGSMGRTRRTPGDAGERSPRADVF